MKYLNLHSNYPSEKPVNIEYVTKNKLCIGCGVCVDSCPNDAINVIYDIEASMPLPTVNEEKCSECRTCLKVCYGIHSDHDLHHKIFGKPATSVIGNFKQCYIGYSNDHSIRSRSTSGGVVTALLLYALEHGFIDGAIVTRMDKGNPPRAKAFIATTPDEILSAGGSKYCPVSFAGCLRALKNKKKYAIVGLPCHIYGIRKLAELHPRIRNSLSFYFGILCGGMPNYFGTLYLLEKYHMENRYITKFEYRGGGWPGRLLIQGKNQTDDRQIKISAPYPEYWCDAYQFFFPYRCTLCHDGFNEISDISFGDAWLPHLIKQDKNGVSLIITRTEAGDSLIQAAAKKNHIKIDSTNVQEITRSQLGLVRFKFSTLRARFNLCRIFGRKLPTIDLSRALSPDFDSYLSAIVLYLGNIMSSKRSLWWLFNIYLLLYSITIPITRVYQSSVGTLR